MQGKQIRGSAGHDSCRHTGPKHSDFRLGFICSELNSCRGSVTGRINICFGQRRTSYKHIDELFTAQVDWDLIATLIPDMMRVAVSIRTGNILPSDILRRLNSSSRKNKLYFGFRELGRVVRTIFLLRYLSDAELRRTIQAATNKSERFNQFVQWVSFGGDSVIAENTQMSNASSSNTTIWSRTS